MPGLVGSRDPAGKTWNALTPELAAHGQVESRRMALDVLAELPAGRVLAAGTGLPSLVARVAWLRPRRPRTRADQVAWAVDEAAALGRDRARRAGVVRPRAAGRRRRRDPRRRSTRCCPSPVDHVLMQADLTAVAPGPAGVRRWPARCSCSPTWSRAAARPSTASRPARCAARSTPAGPPRRSTSSSARSRGPPVPAAADLPRRRHRPHVRHGAGRARRGVPARRRRGRADRAAAPPPGRQPRAAPDRADRAASAPTPIDVLLPRLRELGAAPVVESADGTVHVARPDLRRARTTARRPRGRAAPGPRERARRAGRGRGALRRPRRRQPSGHAQRHAHAERRRWPRCARRSRPARPSSSTTSTTTAPAPSGSSTPGGSRAAGSPRTTTAATTSAPSPSTGSRRSRR